MKLTVINSVLSHLAWQLKKGQGDPKFQFWAQSNLRKTGNFLFNSTLTGFVQNVIKAEVP